MWGIRGILRDRTLLVPLAFFDFAIARRIAGDYSLFDSLDRHPTQTSGVVSFKVTTQATWHFEEFGQDLQD